MSIYGLRHSEADEKAIIDLIEQLYQVISFDVTKGGSGKSPNFSVMRRFISDDMVFGIVEKNKLRTTITEFSASEFELYAKSRFRRFFVTRFIERGLLDQTNVSIFDNQAIAFSPYETKVSILRIPFNMFTLSGANTIWLRKTENKWVAYRMFWTQ